MNLPPNDDAALIAASNLAAAWYAAKAEHRSPEFDIELGFLYEAVISELKRRREAWELAQRNLKP